MNVAELLTSRKKHWEELEAFLPRFRSVRKKRRQLSPEETARFTELYRGVCADLALAEAYRLPPGITKYLNDLVGRTHNTLYSDQSVTLHSWVRLLTVENPRLLFRDATFWFALFLFWGPFLTCAWLAKTNPEFAPAILGAEQLEGIELSFAEPFTNMNPGERAFMGGFYVLNNAGIGLQCFAFGALTAIGTIILTLFNAVTLGTVFGHMSTTASAPQFFEFVTAHGPFELTAIVMAAAAGIRIGKSMVLTQGFTRGDSIRRAAMKSIPIVSTATVLFCLAAPIEAFISPNPLHDLADLGFDPVLVKRGVALTCTCLLLLYIVGLGGAASLGDHWGRLFHHRRPR